MPAGQIAPEDKHFIRSQLSDIVRGEGRTFNSIEYSHKSTNLLIF